MSERLRLLSRYHKEPLIAGCDVVVRIFSRADFKRPLEKLMRLCCVQGRAAIDGHSHHFIASAIEEFTAVVRPHWFGPPFSGNLQFSTSVRKPPDIYLRSPRLIGDIRKP